MRTKKEQYKTTSIRISTKAYDSIKKITAKTGAKKKDVINAMLLNSLEWAKQQKNFIV